MSGSAIDACLLALVAVFTAAAPSDVAVYDAEPVDPPRKFLCVGWDESEEPAVAAVSVSSSAGASPTFDTYEVSNLLSCWAGNEKGPALRAETLTTFGLFSTALAGDFTLNGAAMSARISSYEYMPDRRPDGVIAQVRFTVSILATLA